MKKVIIPVHGIMMYPKGYSQIWKDILQPPPNWDWNEFWWDDINDLSEDKFLWLKNQVLRGIYLFLWDELMDAIRYRFGKKEKAIERLREFLESQKDADEIIVLAHSLGSVLSFDTLQQIDLEVIKKINLITFGSPLTSGFQRWWLEVKNQPIFPKTWINLYGDKRDLIGGRPLKFVNFNPKNNFFFLTSHKEIKYLQAAKSFLFEKYFK